MAAETLSDFFVDDLFDADVGGGDFSERTDVTPGF